MWTKFSMFCIVLFATTILKAQSADDTKKLAGIFESFTGKGNIYYHQYQEIFTAHVHDSSLTFLAPFFTTEDSYISFLEVVHNHDTSRLPVLIDIKKEGSKKLLQMTPIRTRLPLTWEFPKFKDDETKREKTGDNIFFGYQTQDSARNQAWSGTFYLDTNHSFKNITFYYKSIMEIGHLRDSIVVDTLAKRFVNAISVNDRETVAEFMEYPVRITIARKQKRIKTKEELLKKYDKIFTKKRIKLIEEDINGGVWQHEGDWAIGAGTVWFSGSWDEWKVETIN